MEYCKLQIGCMIIVLYVACIYIREKQIYQMKRKNVLFETILAAGIVGIFFDGATAYTVNHLAEIPASVNTFLHLCFLSFLDIFVFLMFLYMYDITRGLPQKRGERIGLFLPLLINIVVVIVFMPQLEYRKGTFTNYSMGMSAYTCFAMVALYVLAASGIFLHSWKNLERHKQIAISTYLLVTIGVTAYQMFFPEALLTSLVPAVVIVGIYLNQETPLYAKLQKNNEEMVMGFATLVENRDDNTGGHIRRTTAYVKLLAEELRSRGFYKEQLTKDYVANLVMAAPMHDVGKIAIPDAILQKPGKLTDEEFEIMKTHAQKGGKIIRETFGHLGNDAYEEMAYEVAAHHHEKWNGRGYPDGLKGDEIPISAQVVPLADVYDALVSERVYKKAYSHEKAIEMITNGECGCFNPILLECLLDIQDRIKRKMKTGIPEDNPFKKREKKAELKEFENVKEDFMDVVSKNMEKEYSNFENDEFVDFSRGGAKPRF